jgi:hypothetical protein
VFPCFGEIVEGVPAFERDVILSELEESTDRLAAAHPETDMRSAGASLLCALVATRDHPRPARPRSIEPRAAG